LLVHAEGHLQAGEDFDRRIALISFDNAIEVAITTYLTLNPIQRGNRGYSKTDLEKWLSNYHSKLDFLEQELSLRKLTWTVERSHIIWAHDSPQRAVSRGPERNAGKERSRPRPEVRPVDILSAFRGVGCREATGAGDSRRVATNATSP
jgi:hypothetical protein